MKKGKRIRFIVFNTLNWVRNDIADIEYTGSYPVKVLDIDTGEETISQLIYKNNKPFLRISAKNIPSVGYMVFEIREELPQKSSNAATLTV